jgi:hypothetical protein
MSRQPEARLVARILLALEAEVGGLWTKIHASPFQRSGFPDIVGCLEGLFIALEVKLPGNDLSPLQEHMIHAIRTKGRGYATRVSSVEEAVRFVKLALGKKRRY